MQCENEKRWNMFFFILGAMLVLGLAYDLHTRPGARFVLESITALEIALLALATFRLVRLFVYDRITKFIRDWFVEKPELGGPVCACDINSVKSGAAHGNHDENGGHCYKSGFKAAVSHLLSCPWCVGVWAALPLAYFYLLTPLAQFPILVLAVAGLASFLQLLANLIGWHAEKKKQEAEVHV